MIDKIYLDKLDSAYMTILDMTKIDIKEKRREKARMDILKIFCHYARNLIKNIHGDRIFTLDFIGKYLNRDHATVLWSIKKHEEYVLVNSDYRLLSEGIIARIKAIEKEKVTTINKRKLAFLNQRATEDLRGDWVDLILEHESHRKNIHLIRKLLETANE